MKILREPLLHFVVIGALLFGAYDLLSDNDRASGEIVVSAPQIASLEAVFSRTWQRPPSAKERAALVEAYIRDEVFYREAIAMGLDRDDAIIRRRMRQKMEFVADLTADVEPTDAELRQFVEAHPASNRAEPRLTFSQIYFRSGSDAGPSLAEMEGLIKDLNGGTADAARLGDPFLAGFDFRDVTRSEVVRTFGESFAGAIDGAGLDRWEGPVSSAYGMHLVDVTARVPARTLPFEDVRETVRREWLHKRKVAANDALFQKLRSRYVITVESGTGHASGARAAERTP